VFQNVIGDIFGVSALSLAAEANYEEEERGAGTGIPSQMFSKIMRKCEMFKSDNVMYEIFSAYKYK
jgi:hypothetical protein